MKCGLILNCSSTVSLLGQILCLDSKVKIVDIECEFPEILVQPKEVVILNDRLHFHPFEGVQFLECRCTKHLEI